MFHLIQLTECTDIFQATLIMSLETLRWIPGIVNIGGMLGGLEQTHNTTCHWNTPVPRPRHTETIPRQLNFVNRWR